MVSSSLQKVVITLQIFLSCPDTSLFFGGLNLNCIIVLNRSQGIVFERDLVGSEPVTDG